MFKLIKYRQPYSYPPRGYRVAYPDIYGRGDVCYPIGIHWIAMLLRWLYHASYYVRMDELDTLRSQRRHVEYCLKYQTESAAMWKKTASDRLSEWANESRRSDWFLNRTRESARRYGQHRKLAERVKLLMRWWPTEQLIEQSKRKDERGRFSREVLGIAQDCGFFGERNQFARPCYRHSTRVTVDVIGASSSFERRCVEEETPDVVFVVIRKGEPYEPGRMVVCLTREEAERQYAEASVYPVSAKGVLARLIAQS